MFNIFALIGKFGFLNFFWEMFLAQTGFMYRHKRRKYWPLRMAACLICSAPIYFLPPLKTGPFQFAFLVVVAYVLLCGLFCYRGSFMNSLFSALAAFAAQHFAWSSLLIIYKLLPPLNWAAGISVYLGGFAAVYAAIFFVFPFRTAVDVVKNQRGAALLGSALILVITFILNSLVSGRGHWNVLYGCYALVCCTFALCMQFGVIKSSRLQEKNARLEQEKVVLRRLLYQEQKQQEYSKETIEYINMKCHDLKHQISVLRYVSPDKREKSISDIERAVMIYDHFAKTGNEALDIVLTEKGLLCEKYGIRFTYIVDGEKLSFMDPVDVSSLFGNAVGNAIESVVKESDKDKRIIKLNVSARYSLLTVSVENYCAGGVHFENGMPVTDKPDKNNHGFGVKSMAYIVEKYGGSMVMGQKGNIFSVSIVLPLPAKVCLPQSVSA